MSSGTRMSRRTMLRGLGAAMALPWLEAMESPLHAAGIPGGGSAIPRRMGFIFVPNGAHLPRWTPLQEGFDFELPFILEPLAPVRQDVLVLTGLTHDKGRANGDGPGDHARSASVFLTGAQPRKTSGANLRSGISADQLAAQAIGDRTPFPSLELGCEEGRQAGNCDSGYSCAYSSSISWAGEATPLGKQTNPRLVFERLFARSPQAAADSGRLQREAIQKSVLDFVREDAHRLQQTLGTADRRKLDEYLTGVRELERRVDRSDRLRLARSRLGDYDAPEGIPESYQEHLRLMCDLIVLSLQTDLTRIFTFMFANAGSNRSYRMIDVPEGHHNLSHHGGDPVKHEKISKINRFHVAQLAYLIGKLKSAREGDGSLLDSCMIVYGSGISDGNRHNNENLPVLLAGRGGGTICSGRHLRYEYETPMTNLFMSLLDRMGVGADHVGDSTGYLSCLDG